jgi:hypothetical protein
LLATWGRMKIGLSEFMKLTYKGRGRGPRGAKRGVGAELERAGRYPKGYSNPDRAAILVPCLCFTC